MRLLARDELMTLGANERDIDWRSAWLAELAKDDQPGDRRKGALQLWRGMPATALSGNLNKLLSQTWSKLPGEKWDGGGLAAPAHSLAVLFLCDTCMPHSVRLSLRIAAVTSASTFVPHTRKPGRPDSDAGGGGLGC